MSIPTFRTAWSAAAGGACRRKRALALLSLAGLLCAGCADNLPAVTVTPTQKLELQRRSVDLLLRAATSAADDVSCNALDALVKVAPRDGLPAFRQAVRSDSPLVRFAGYAALGEVRDCDSRLLFVAGIKDANPHVRLAAAFAACRCGQSGYASLLVHALTSAREDTVRRDAAFLLGRLGEPRAEKHLRAALRIGANEKSRPVLLTIYGALATLGQEDAVRELVRYAQGDLETRVHALLLLADLGLPETKDALRYRFLTNNEDYVEARLLAARGLGKLGFRDGFDLALKMLKFTDPNPNPDPDNPSRTFPVRSMAVHALAEIGDPRALGALRELAASQDEPRLQVAAAYAICRILAR
jgi:HEAT repeat protein